VGRAHPERAEHRAVPTERENQVAAVSERYLGPMGDILRQAGISFCADERHSARSRPGANLLKGLVEIALGAEHKRHPSHAVRRSRVSPSSRPLVGREVMECRAQGSGSSRQ
jgi:hypothetical protein